MVVVMRAKEIYERVREEVRSEVKVLEELGITPSLAVLLLNDDPMELETQLKFVGLKGADCKYVGIDFRVYELYRVPVERRTKEALKLIKMLNVADDVTGILIQKPLPRGVDEDVLYEALDPRKDVDGLTPHNKRVLLGKFDLGKDLLPCTPAGVLELLDHYGIVVEGMDAVVVGRSDLVGRPMALMLERRGATVTILHSKSKNKEKKVAEADLVVSAVGRPPELYGDNPWRITGEMIKEGAIVVGIGGKFDPVTGKWYFDVDEGSVSKRASYMTPNLGGVGLMTRARLLKNIIIAARAMAKVVVPP